jgi:hypothetical protein
VAFGPGVPFNTAPTDFSNFIITYTSAASKASAMVTGVARLVLAEREHYSASQLRQHLFDTTVDLEPPGYDGQDGVAIQGLTAANVKTGRRCQRGIAGRWLRGWSTARLGGEHGTQAPPAPAPQAPPA